MKKSILIVLFLLFIPIECIAIRINVAPPLIELEMPSGGLKTFPVTIINDGDDKVRLKVYTSDFVVGRDGLHTFPSAGTSKYSCASWIKVESPEITLEPRKGKDVICTLSLPPGVVGGRYAGIMVEIVPRGFEKKKEEEGSGGGMAVHWTMGSIVKVRIGKTGLQRKAEISDIKIFTRKTDYNFIVTLENKGNVDILSKAGQLLIKKFGKTIKTLPLTTNTYTILPDVNLRDFKAVLNRPLLDGDYILEAKIGYEERGIAIAKKEIFVENEVIKEGRSGKPLLTETPLAFSIEPGELEIKISGGAFRAGYLRVSNQDTEPIYIDTELVDVSIDADGKSNYLPAGTMSYSLDKYITFFPSSFYIAPNATNIIKYQVKIPKEVEGGRYGVLICRAKAGKRNGECEVKITLTTIPDSTLKKEAELSQLKISQHVKELKISGIFENKGNVHLPVIGKITILDNMGVEVKTIPIDVGIVLPGEKRVIEIISSHDLPKGMYTFKMTIDYADKKSTFIEERFFIR